MTLPRASKLRLLLAGSKLNAIGEIVLPLLEEKEVAVNERRFSRSDIETAAREKYRSIEWLLPALFCAVLLAQLILSGGRLSQTGDEATHLYAGYRYLKCSDLTVSPEHPPFAKVVAALPLLSMNVAVDCTPFNGDSLRQALTSVDWFYGQNWTAVLPRTRAAVSLFAVGLCLLVWITARRMFGLATAVVASALLVFEPNVLAYGSLIMTDVPVTGLMLLTVLTFYAWIRHRTVPFLLVTGVVTGLTLLTKHSGVVILPILGALAIADAIRPSGSKTSKWRFAGGNLLAIVLIGVLAVGIVWIGYGLRFASYPGAPEIAATWPVPSSAVGRLLAALESLHVMPDAYLRGFGAALALSNQSSDAFVAGKIYLQAPWFSTPFNFAIRNTAAMLLLIPAGAFGMVMTWRKRSRERLFVLIPITVFLAVCVRASSNVSMRYLLPILPFLLIAVADGCVELIRRVRWAGYALPVLIVLHAVSSLHAYPNYLSFANELWGGPSHAYKYLPWLDMGQAYPEARAYLEKHPSNNCWLVAGWQWDPAIYDLPCVTSGRYLTHQMPSHVHGTVILSSTLLNSVGLPEQQLAGAFKNASPKDRIAGSALLVYEGDFDTSLNAATVEKNLAAAAFVSGQDAAALVHSERELVLAPTSATAHGDHCIFLARSQVALALQECYTARELLLRDPLREEAGRKEYLESLERALVGLREKYRSIYKQEPSINSRQRKFWQVNTKR